MPQLIATLALLSILGIQRSSLPAAPFDMAVGRQAVALHKPLVASMAGARLVLFIRHSEGLVSTGSTVIDQFKTDVPEGSVSAILTDSDGGQRTFQHTGYTFYRGYKGLTLTNSGTPIGPGLEMYRALELDAKLALDGVRMVWLDRGAKRFAT